MPDKKSEDNSGAHIESTSEKEGEDDEAEFVERDPTGRYGRYNEILGKGAFKTVYRAFDEVDGIEVAWNQVKVQDVLQSPEDLERLYSEVHLLKSLKHKNIIKLYNSWVDTKTKNVNFITEIFTSGTLRQYRKKHKHVDLRAVKNWAKQILRGLLYLHSHNPPIIHRDLKCDNIFVNGNQGEVKIGDLGLAAILRHAHAAHSVIGTPEFMAPELYEEEYNELVDIYSFGMCLLEMVTFEYPYSECTNAAQIYKKVTSGKKPAALDKVKDQEVRAFIEKCLATASKRLPARELLMDPFLQSDGDREPIDLMPPISRSTSRADDMEGLGTIKEEPSGRSVSRVETSSATEDARDRIETSEENDEPSPSDEQLGSPESGHSGTSEGSGNYQRSLSFSLKEDGKRSRDFRVKGKKKDDDTVFLRVRIADLEGHIRNIHFPFSIEGDTAMSVASEMVAELDLSDQDVTTIAEMIDAAIVALVPEWRPGASFEDNGGNEVDDQPKDENTPIIQDPMQAEEGATAAAEIVHADDALEIENITNGEGALRSRSPKTGPATAVSYSPRLEGTMHGRFEEVTYHLEGSEFPYKYDAPHIFSSGSSEVREDGDEWDLTGEVGSPVASNQGTFCLDVKTERTPTNLLKIVEHQNSDASGSGCNEVLVTIKSSGCASNVGEVVDTGEDIGTCQESMPDSHRIEGSSSADTITVLIAPGDLSNSAEQDESIARELKLLAMRQEQELRELQRKHESALLEIRNRCRCKRSSSLNSPQLSSPHNQNVDPLSRLLDSELDLQQVAASHDVRTYDLRVGEASTPGQNAAGTTSCESAETSSSGCLPLHWQTTICKPEQGICFFEQDITNNPLAARSEDRRPPSSPSASCSNECFADLLDLPLNKSGYLASPQSDTEIKPLLRPAGTWPQCNFLDQEIALKKENGLCDSGAVRYETLFDGSETFVDATCSEKPAGVAEFSGKELLGHGKQVAQDDLPKAGLSDKENLSLSRHQLKVSDSNLSQQLSLKRTESGTSEQQRKEQLQKSIAELEAKTLEGLHHSRNGYLVSSKKNVGI